MMSELTKKRVEEASEIVRIVNFTVRNRPKTPSEIVRNRPKRPNQASESSEMSLDIRTGASKFGRDNVAGWRHETGFTGGLGNVGLIDRLTAEAQAARDAFGYGTLRYTDAKGTRVRVITGDVWEQIERADAHFGCKGDPVRFARALAVGRQR